VVLLPSPVKGSLLTSLTASWEFGNNSPVPGGFAIVALME
jgi:hypothetical protein